MMNQKIIFSIFFSFLLMFLPSSAFADSVSGHHGFEPSCYKYTPKKVDSCSIQSTSDGLKVTKDRGGGKGTIVCATEKISTKNDQNRVVVRFGYEGAAYVKPILFVNSKEAQSHTPITISSKNLFIDLCLEQFGPTTEPRSIMFKDVKISWVDVPPASTFAPTPQPAPQPAPQPTSTNFFSHELNFSIDGPTFSDPWFQSAYDGFEARVTWFTPDKGGFAQVLYTDTLGPQINADKNTTMYELSKWEKHKSEEIMYYENFRIIEKSIIENNNFTFYILKTSAYCSDCSDTSFSYDALIVNLQKGNAYAISVQSWNDSNFYKSGESEELFERMLHSFSPGPPGSAPIYPSNGSPIPAPTPAPQPASTPSPTLQSTQSEDSNILIVGIIIALIIAGIIAIVVKNKNKPKISPYAHVVSPSASTSTSGPSRFARTTCKHCHRKIDPASTIDIDGIQKCPYCNKQQ